MIIKCPSCGHKGEPKEMVLEIMVGISEAYTIDDFTFDGTPIIGKLLDSEDGDAFVHGYECRYCGYELLEGGRGSGILQQLENLYSIKHET